MTERQYEVYNFIVDFIKENNYAPTVREIAKGVYLSSTATVYTHLHNLEDKGWISIVPNSPRSIRVIGYEFSSEQVSCGRITKEMRNIIIREMCPYLSYSLMTRLTSALDKVNNCAKIKREKQ